MKVCINSWFFGPEALTKFAHVANMTMTLRGLDEFLVQTQELIKKIEELAE